MAKKSTVTQADNIGCANEQELICGFPSIEAAEEYRDRVMQQAHTIAKDNDFCCSACGASGGHEQLGMRFLPIKLLDQQHRIALGQDPETGSAHVEPEDLKKLGLCSNCVSALATQVPNLETYHLFQVMSTIKKRIGETVETVRNALNLKKDRERRLGGLATHISLLKKAG